jgi:peptidoglycan/xylan/chitin deacetylase (PgdA/CDA1 family)
MVPYFKKVPESIQKLCPNRLWKIHTSNKELYLTFDDGPHPDTTMLILDLLSKYSAKVTFFQIGSKIMQFPDLTLECRKRGHTIGNHGFEHLDAWQSLPKSFYSNVNKGQNISDSSLFRPPFGRLPLFGKEYLFRANKVVMWDLMPGDFDENNSFKDCQQTVMDKAENGSIIALHENDRSRKKVLKILPFLLDYFSGLGYQFKCIEDPSKLKM